MVEFKEFPKIARWSRDIVITEKIDGTNRVVYVSKDLATITAGTRSRWITPEADDYGFARWVHENRDSLIADLGPGYHYGEWWGQGIQRYYDMTEKRLSLFNTNRWANASFQTPQLDVVPKLYEGPISNQAVEQVLQNLAQQGSMASPGFMEPEGIVIFHTAADVMFKKTIKKDELPKGVVR